MYWVCHINISTHYTLLVYSSNVLMHALECTWCVSMMYVFRVHASRRSAHYVCIHQTSFIHHVFSLYMRIMARCSNSMYCVRSENSMNSKYILVVIVCIVLYHGNVVVIVCIVLHQRMSWCKT